MLSGHGRGNRHVRGLSPKCPLLFRVVCFRRLCAIDKGLPNKEYNLGSKNSPDIRTLLKGVIASAHSHSAVIPTPGKLVKFILNIFDSIGLTIMYKEQFMIADEEYILDIKQTEDDLDWHPQYNDEDMLKEAYQMYKKQ